MPDPMSVLTEAVREELRRVNDFYGEKAICRETILAREVERLATELSAATKRAEDAERERDAVKVLLDAAVNQSLENLSIDHNANIERCKACHGFGFNGEVSSGIKAHRCSACLGTGKALSHSLQKGE